MTTTTKATARGYAATAAKGELAPYEYDLGPIGPHDVEVAVTHCGVCHSDLAMIDDDWHYSKYPLVPGHEVVGTVAAVGAAVAGLAVGQRVGLGWQCGSCGTCEWCATGKEQLCAGEVDTIVGRPGGWADRVRADARFVVPVPDALASADAAPLMCAGTTVFSPLVHHGVTPTMRTAVVGVGGLGHLAVQFLARMGCEVTAVSSTHSKDDEAKRLGATRFVATKGTDELTRAAGSFDFMLVTVSADIPWPEYVAALRPEGTLCLVGLPEADLRIHPFGFVGSEKRVVGGRAGSPSDTRRMLAFAARHGVKPMVEEFPLAEVNRAVNHVRAGKARYRAVLRA